MKLNTITFKEFQKLWREEPEAAHDMVAALTDYCWPDICYDLIEEIVENPSDFFIFFSYFKQYINIDHIYRGLISLEEDTHNYEVDQVLRDAEFSIYQIRRSYRNKIDQWCGPFPPDYVFEMLQHPDIILDIIDFIYQKEND